MFTILIPVLKEGFLQSQLLWLSKQTYRDFSVVAMDSFYKSNRYKPWASRSYPFNFNHVPLIHNIRFPKRCDLSIKNNLAMLSPTNNFIFLSDTHYVRPEFAESIAYNIVNEMSPAIFKVSSLFHTAYDSFKHTVDFGGEVTYISKPVTVFDRKKFFYLLNGFDEATTYAYASEFMLERFVNTTKSKPVEDMVYHILHGQSQNDFGDRWTKPCDKCNSLFPRWKFDMAMDTGSFSEDTDDYDLVEQMLFRDPDVGIPMFQCPNCGFGGCVSPLEYKDLIMRERLIEAPVGLLDGNTGRNLTELYETITKKVNNNINAKLSYLRTTY